MKVSIVIPVFNEIKTIEKILARVASAPLPPEISERELIVVDDCSTDGTREFLEKYSTPQVKVFYHEKNQGKGAALRTGFAQAGGDIVMIQDADLEYDPGEYPKILQPIIDGQADVVYGSRFIGSQPHRILYYWHFLGNRMLTLLSNIFSDLNLSDMETCYKVFKREVIQQILIEENRFGFEPEITAKVAALAKKQHIAIYEVGISYFGRTYQEGKKIGFSDAARAFWCILKYNTSALAQFCKYFAVGVLAGIFQLLIMYILVSRLGWKDLLKQNLAHLISLEFFVFFSSWLQATLTWRRRAREPVSFAAITGRFHFYSLTMVIVRVSLFIILFQLSVGYVKNILFGLFISLCFDFRNIGRHVFNRSPEAAETEAAPPEQAGGLGG